MSRCCFRFLLGVRRPACALHALMALGLVTRSSESLCCLGSPGRASVKLGKGRSYDSSLAATLEPVTCTCVGFLPPVMSEWGCCRRSSPCFTPWTGARWWRIWRSLMTPERYWHCFNS